MRTLQADAGTDGPAEGIKRLQELIDEKRSEVEQLRERISEAERQLGELSAAEGTKPESSNIPGEAIAANALAAGPSLVPGTMSAVACRLAAPRIRSAIRIHRPRPDHPHVKLRLTSCGESSAR